MKCEERRFVMVCVFQKAGKGRLNDQKKGTELSQIEALHADYKCAITPAETVRLLIREEPGPKPSPRD